jgi:hypothetical protein
VRLNRLVLSLVCFVACLGASTVSFARNSGNTKTGVDARLGSSASDEGGIREVVPAKYQKRYKEWKEEFLSTPMGRQQWEFYSTHTRFSLTLTMSNKNESGAGSGKYKWNDAGQLIAATITLGSKLDEGFPSAVYYPVMNALAPFRSANLIDGNILAAAKLAHEFGHIMKISSTPKELYNLQVKLVPLYNDIFLHNGYNVNDPRLIELAKKMGGNPVEIWEDREYWGEANAMLFLRDRVATEKYHCRLFGKIKQIVDMYAKDYEERFAEIAKAQSTSSCSWR